MNCLLHIIKYILYLLNLIFVVCGILLIVLGSIMISHVRDFSSFNDLINLHTIPILIILLGCIVFVVSFFGCCGAVRESVCCTTIYAVFMIILFALQIALVAWIFSTRNHFLKITGEIVDEAWIKNDEANGYPMDTLQMSFDCCGRNNYTDYTSENKAVPKTCCGSLKNECTENVYMAKPGCRTQFVHFWATNTNIIRYAGIGVALFELVTIVFATCLASNIRKSRHGF